MDELLTQFAVEARELVEQATEDLLCLEIDPNRRENLESVFRSVHTLKGSVGLFNFGPMLGVLHQAEELLSEVRANDLTLDGTLVDVLLAVIQWIDDAIPGILETGKLLEVHEKQASPLLARLTHELAEQSDRTVCVVPGTAPQWVLSLQERAKTVESKESLIAIRYQPHPECFFDGDDPFATMIRVQNLTHIDISFTEDHKPFVEQDPFRCSLLIEALCFGPLEALEDVFRAIPDQVDLYPLAVAPRLAGQVSPVSSGGVKSTTMRVDTARIDRLVEIASELIVAANGLVPLAKEIRENDALVKRILASHSQIERLVGSLHGAVTQARMIPLDHTFRRFSRLVRETSVRLGKPIDLMIDGETVEADKEVVESLFEPILHVIRNAMDHGIETQLERQAHSKPVRALIHISARQRGKEVEIDLTDDGRGINTDRVKTAAVERGLLSVSSAEMLSEQEVFQLLFSPGFSTASSISDLSGRGVGLDAVQNALQKLGGNVEVRSIPGSGTTFTFILPISFSMSQLMIVEVSDERYGVPMSDIVETHRLPACDLQTISAGEVFVLRDEIIPFIHLGDLLGLRRSCASVGDFKVLIVNTHSGKVGIGVDAITDRTETLTRPLTRMLNKITGIYGTTLRSDGRVLLILDVKDLLP